MTKYLLFCKSNKSVAKTPIGNFSALFKAPSSSEILGVLAKHLIFSHSIIEHYRSPRPEQKFIKNIYISWNSRGIFGPIVCRFDNQIIHKNCNLSCSDFSNILDILYIRLGPKWSTTPITAMGHPLPNRGMLWKTVFLYFK